MTAPVTGSSRITFHDLHVRSDRDEYIVGRVETGEFVAVPGVAVEALHLLTSGLSVDEARQRLRDDHGRDIDIARFVDGLTGLEFVAAIDGQPLASRPVPAATFPRLRPGHARWLVNPAVGAAMAAVVVAGVIALAVQPRIVPAYHDLLWSQHASVVVLGNAAIGWSIVFVHELAHLLTARAAGIPGRVRLGTRLQFLVAQTDVSSIWAAPRRARLAVYLSGVAVNLTIAAAALLARAAAPHADGAWDGAGTADRLAAAVVILALVPVPIQFLVFMRTDVYFALQDLAGCRNLYGDGSAYLRWRANRLLRPLKARVTVDPSARLPNRTSSGEGLHLGAGHRHGCLPRRGRHRHRAVRGRPAGNRRQRYRHRP